MAKYADYVGKQETVEQELQSTQVQTRQRNIPESVTRRFDGKSLEDVLESYAELERLGSRQGEDLGKLRKTVDQLLELQSQYVQPQTQTQTQVVETGITTDDLYADPNAAVSRVVKKESKETADRLARVEQELSRREVELGMQTLEGKYAGWRNEISTPEFLNWVAASPARSRLAASANSYDFAAANDLLELWYDKKGSISQVNDTAQREQQFRDATLESSSPGQLNVADGYSRADLQEKRIAAKLGNRQAQRYLEAHAAAINQAYAEGRITN
jgi:hypothetical protein